MRRFFRTGALILGILLIVLAGLTKWVVAPRMTMLPGDTDTSRYYTGTAAVMSNPTSLTGTLFGPGLLRNVPVTVRHTDKVLSTEGRTALVADQRVVSVPGFTAADLNYRFGVDRKTFQPAGDFADLSKSAGITFNFPMGTQRHDYQGWVPDIQRTTTLTYAGQATRDGVDTYVFKADGPAYVITDPELLKILPSEMTKKDLMQLTPSLGFGKNKLLKLNDQLATLPDPVPLEYTYQGTATFWVAPDSGLIVDMVQSEVRSVQFVAGPQKRIPVTPIMDMTYRMTPASIAAAAQDARDAIKGIQLIEVTAPLVLLGGGILLLIVGLAIRPRRRPEPPTAPPVEAEAWELVGTR
jgi:hypothetical protein